MVAENIPHFQNKLNSRGAADLLKLEMMTNVLVILASLCAMKKACFQLPTSKLLIINSMYCRAPETASADCF